MQSAAGKPLGRGASMIALATGIACLAIGAGAVLWFQSDIMKALRDSNLRLNSSLQSKKRILSDVHDYVKDQKSGTAQRVARMTEGEV